MAVNQVAGGAGTFILRVFRYDPEKDQNSRYQDYEVPWREGLTVLEALFYVLEKLDSTLAFRYSCREAICGSCAMYISGSYRLACQTQVADARRGNVVQVDPLPHMKVLKDLVVDMKTFWQNYERVKPYLINDTPAPDKERLQSPEQRKKINEMVDCILCAACYSACPSNYVNKDYLGAYALTKAYRFYADSRDTAKDERLNIVDNEFGVFRCHTIFNCAEACPKEINQTFSIQELKKAAVKRKLGFGPR